MRYVVDTPEHISFSYTLAGIGSRGLAAIIDTLLILLLQLILAVVLLLSGAQLDNAGISLAESLVLAIWSLLAFVLLWGYYVLFELLWNGQSPGKRLLRLRTVREGGRPIHASAVIIRNLVRAIDLLPLGYGLGVLVMFVDRQDRRLGDLAAGTLVVREPRTLSLQELVAAQQAPAAPIASTMFQCRRRHRQRLTASPPMIMR
jgi:uncharacterized RDD family membrane protein YckC